MGFGNLGIKEAVTQSKSNQNSTYRPDFGSRDLNIGTEDPGRLTGNPFVKEKAKNGKRKARTPFTGGNTLDSTGIFLSYPIARTPSEKTGDTLLIKCIEYVPPGPGAGLDLKVDNTFAFN